MCENVCAAGKCEWACVGGLRTAASGSLLLKRGSPSVGRKAAPRAQPAGAQMGSRSPLGASGFYSPPGESNRVGRRRRTCNTRRFPSSADDGRTVRIGGGNSRVSQEEQVEHRVVFAEVDQRPAEHPAAHGEQAEPGGDQEHVAEQRSAAALGHLYQTDGGWGGVRETHRTRTLELLHKLRNRVRVLTSETIVQTSLLANMTVMKVARW